MSKTKTEYQQRFYEIYDSNKAFFDALLKMFVDAYDSTNINNKRLLENILHWFPCICKDYWWGFESILDVIETKLRQIDSYVPYDQKRFKNYRRLPIALNLLKRIKNNKYSNMFYHKEYDENFPIKVDLSYSQGEKVKTYDMEYLFHMLFKNRGNWND